MNVKTLKGIHHIKKNYLLPIWNFCMSPIATIINYHDVKVAERKRKEIDELTIEAAAKLYVKCTIKDMIKRDKLEKKYYDCAKKSGNPDYYEDGFFLSNLSTYRSGIFNNTPLRYWYYLNPECVAIGYGPGHEERWLALENKFREFAANEFLHKGCVVSYIDESTYLDKRFVNLSGYKKTMVVTIK